MKWNKMLRHLRKHYDIYDPIYQLSEQEAKEILVSNGYQPFHVMLEAILGKHNFSPEIHQALMPAMERSKRKQKKPLISVHINRRFAKAIIAIVVVIVTAIFFVFHPGGQSLANNIWSFFVEQIGNRIVIKEDPDIHITFDDNLYPQSTPDMKEKYVLIDKEAPEFNELLPPETELLNTVSNFKADTGCSQVAYFKSDWFYLASISLKSYGANKNIVTDYRTENGSSFSLVQTWHADPSAASLVISADDPEYYTYAVADDITMHCVFDKKDNIFFGCFAVGNCMFDIMARDGIDVSQLFEALTWI